MDADKCFSYARKAASSAVKILLRCSSAALGYPWRVRRRQAANRPAANRPAAQSIVEAAQVGRGDPARQRENTYPRKSIARDRPSNSDIWTARAAMRYGLESRWRDPWRPKKEGK